MHNYIFKSEGIWNHLKNPEQIENVHKFISPMKLKAFSKRAFSIVAASLTIFTSPSFAKSDHIGKAAYILNMYE